MFHRYNELQEIFQSHGNHDQMKSTIKKFLAIIDEIKELFEVYTKD
jgi:hypothetical protein